MKQKALLILVALALVIAGLYAGGATEEEVDEPRSSTFWTTEDAMGECAAAAFAAGDLLDVIYHPLAFTLSWLEGGILDSISAAEVIRNLGEDTYTRVLRAISTGSIRATFTTTTVRR